MKQHGRFWECRRNWPTEVVTKLPQQNTFQKRWEFVNNSSWSPPIFKQKKLRVSIYQCQSLPPTQEKIIVMLLLKGILNHHDPLRPVMKAGHPVFFLNLPSFRWAATGHSLPCRVPNLAGNSFTNFKFCLSTTGTPTILRFSKDWEDGFTPLTNRDLENDVIFFLKCISGFKYGNMASSVQTWDRRPPVTTRSLSAGILAKHPKVSIYFTNLFAVMGHFGGHP